MRFQRSVSFLGAVVCFLGSLAFGQTQVATPTPAERQGEVTQPKAVEADYGKLNKIASLLRARNTEQFAIKTARGIDEAGYISIGGIEQWVTIRGEDRANPVLLFVHGGPGDVTNPWSFALFAAWQRYFTVVQWDERDAGRTLRKNGAGDASTVTLDRMAQDGTELAGYLTKHLEKEKIILVAHSFGTILGLRMVRLRPSLFYAYVGTGQVADETRNYAVAYDALLKKAEALADHQAQDELRRIGPPPYKSGEGYRVQRKWANRFEGADQFLYGTIGLTLVAPGNSVQDLVDSADGQELSAERLVPQTTSAGPKEIGLSFATPIFFFQGDEDFTTPPALAREYLAALKAPKKDFVSINGGHFAVFTNSNDFLRELVSKVRPLATGADIPAKK
jgi:pimeloyl-ACP methyl ester carboxylesterase